MTSELAPPLRFHDEAQLTLGAGVGGSAASAAIPLPRRQVERLPHPPAGFLAPTVRESLRRRVLGVGDALAAAVALTFVLVGLNGQQPGAAIVAGVPLLILLCKIAGLYDRDQVRLAHSTLDEAPQLLQLSGLFALAMAILQQGLTGQPLDGSHIAALWLVTFLASMAARLAGRSLTARALAPERCLVVGDAQHAARIREKLANSRARATVIGSLPLTGVGAADLNDPEQIRQIATELRVHRLVIAPVSTDESGVSDLVRSARAAGVPVTVVPKVLEVVGSAAQLEDIEGMTMLGVRPFGLSGSTRLIKRGFDLAVTSVCLLAAAPVLAVLAAAVKLDSRGPVFFRQVRVGRDGHEFHIIKFRSMVTDADAQKDELRSLNEVGHGMFKLTTDPRVTRVGRFLRRTSLDELPQLFNVMRGEMSLVGPRPLVIDEDVLVLGLDRSRLHLTPGMTGPWQILRARAPMHDMLGIDYIYVANWSLWLDCKLLVRTVRHVCRSGNV
ncbi:MAG: hypothetical protein QOK49_3679 [Baekduia sp.]|nr:hypothetical protein [Baekduia sp.]